MNFTTELELIKGIANDHNERINKEIAKVLAKTEPWTPEFYSKALPVLKDAYLDIAEGVQMTKVAVGVVASAGKQEAITVLDMLEELTERHLLELDEINVPENATDKVTYDSIFNQYKGLFIGYVNIADEIEKMMLEEM